MYYTASEGVRNSWRDRLRSVTSHIKHHNWLPMAIATIVTAWLALILSGLNQTDPATPGTPGSYVKQQDTNSSLNVDYSGNDQGDISVNNTHQASTDNTSTSTGSASISVQPASQFAAAAEDVIGGREADTGTPTTPAAPSTDSDSLNTQVLNVDLGVPLLLDASASVGGDSFADLNLSALGL